MFKIFIISLFFFPIFSLFIYLTIDNKNFINQSSFYHHKRKMPFGIYPVNHYEYPQHFDLIDDDGYEIIGNGFRYEQCDFTIKQIWAYGFNDTSIIVKCSDSLNKIRFLSSFKTGNQSKKGNPEISFREQKHNPCILHNNTYQWYEVYKK
jgi:hypothetical protein